MLFNISRTEVALDKSAISIAPPGRRRTAPTALATRLTVPQGGRTRRSDTNANEIKPKEVDGGDMGAGRDGEKDGADGNGNESGNGSGKGKGKGKGGNAKES